MTARPNAPAMFRQAGEAVIRPVVDHAFNRGHYVGVLAGRHVELSEAEERQAVALDRTREHKALVEAELDHLEPGWRKRIGGGNG